MTPSPRSETMRERTQLVELPCDLKALIASHLDVGDARSFALTCRGLQDAGESVIWRNLDLSMRIHEVPYIPDSDDSDYEDHDGTPRDELVSEMETEVVYCARIEEVLSWLKKAARITHVRSLGISICTGHIHALNLEACRLLCDQVLEVALDVVIYPEPDANWLLDYTDAVRQFLLALADQCNFVRAEKVSAVCTVRWQEDLKDIFCAFPIMRHLSLQEKLNFMECVKYVTPPIWPACSNLRKVELLGFSDYDHAAPLALLHHLRHVPDLHIGNTALNPDASDKFVKALRDHPSLRTLQWSGSDQPWVSRSLRMLFNGDGMEHMRTLIMPAGVFTEFETYLESFTIPTATDIKYLVIPCRSDKWYGDARAPHWGKAPPPRGAIAAPTIKQLQDAAALEVIYFSVDNEPEVDPLQWCDKRISGVLVRSYTKGGDTFFHLRRLELKKTKPSIYERYNSCGMAECTDIDHQWMDQTHYGGYRVADDVLDKVYKVLGEKKEWVTPGRDLELPGKAWKLLEQGKKKQRKQR